MSVDELLKDPILRAEMIEALSKIRDIERLINRIVYKNANCGDLLSLSASLAQLPKLVECLKTTNTKLLSGCAQKIDVLSDIRKLIDDNIATYIKHNIVHIYHNVHTL